MSYFPMHCPACEEDFDTYSQQNCVDCSGEPNTNINITATCPSCGFIVISEFNYDEHYSNQLMEDANKDTHTRVAVPVTKYVSKWVTHKEAKKLEDEEE